MAETTNTNMMLTGVRINKTASIKPDGDSDEKKSVNLVIDFDGVTLAQVLQKAVSSEVIRWQGQARNKFDTISDGETITHKFAAPPAHVDPETAMVNRLVGMTEDEMKAEFDRMREEALKRQK